MCDAEIGHCASLDFLMGAMGIGTKAFVHRGVVSVATEVRNPPSLILRSVQYDRYVGAFAPVEDDWGTLTLPLAEDEYVAAVDHVGCRKTGLVCTFLVVATRESITIGRLDVENSTFEPSGSISLPHEGGGEAEESLECWMVDGPTLVVRYQGNVVVASERQEHSFPYVEFGSHGCAQWMAYMVKGPFEKVFVAGNQVLCVPSVSADSTSLGYLGLVNFPIPSDSQVGCCSPTLAKVELPLEFNPCRLTCVVHVPSGLGLSYKVVYGTSDRRLKFCSREKVIKEVVLEECPLSLQLAQAAQECPLLIVSLYGMDRKVMVLGADSLSEIHLWTGVQQVLVNDVAKIGHDQVLLVPQCLSLTAAFEECLRISFLEFSPQTASDKHKSEILKSVTEALELRLQDGVKLLQATEQRRSDKMDMLSAACNLMQSIVVHPARSKIGDVDVPDDALRMDGVKLQEVYLGRCFLIVNVHVNKNAPEGLHIRRPTLFATSLHGFVKSSASCLPCHADSQRFLFSFPLKECHFPLHVILGAEIRIDKSRSSAWDPVGLDCGVQECEIGKAPQLYTQWLHTIEALAVRNHDTKVAGSSSDLSDVCEKWLSLLGGPISKDHLSALVRAVLIQTNSATSDLSCLSILKEHAGHDMIEKLTKSPLSMMYAHDSALMRKNLPSTNFESTLLKLHGPKLAEMVNRFADVMYQEIESIVNEGSGSKSLAELQAISDRCFCHLLTSLSHNTFARFQTSVEDNTT